MDELIKADLVAFGRAAALIGIEPKRLLGRMVRNKLGDPIGGMTPEGIKVYAWSLPTVDDSTAEYAQGGRPAVKAAGGLP